MQTKLNHLKTDLFGAGLKPGGSGTQLYMTAQTVSVAMAVTIVASLFAAWMYAPYSTLLCVVHAVNAVVYLAAYLAFRKNPDPTLVTRLCCGSVFVVFVVVNVSYGGIMSPAIVWFVLPAVASALILGWREGWTWLILGCITVSVIYVCELAGVVPPSILPAEILKTSEYLHTIGFALVLGLLFSFWVARQRGLQSQLHESLEQSRSDTATANLFADSAVAANGTMNFDRSGALCLELVCRARGWRAGHIWRSDGEGGLVTSGNIYVPPGTTSALAASSVDTCPDGLSARIAADTLSAIVGPDLANDPRFTNETGAIPRSVLAWPVEVDGTAEIILEFFSDDVVVIDDELRRMLEHIAAQLTHVRLREKMRDQTELLAYTDSVTGLPNRAGFEHLFEQKLKECRRKQSRMALMFVDLDGFKRVNDSLGHAVGDRLLKSIGKRLEQHVRESDVAAKFQADANAVAARLGGDEFTLVVSDVDDAEGVAGVARRFLDVLAQPVDVGFQDVNIGASIGIAMYPDDGKMLSDLMRLADAAMYEAKALPGNQFRFATPALNDAIQRRLWIETELHRAIRNDELKMQFMPVAGAMTGRLVGNEILLRWPHRDGEIPVEEFFAVAESSGLVAELGYWTIEKTCAAIAKSRWSSGEHLNMCVDISLLHLQQPRFVDVVTKTLRRYGTPTGALEFEFSDTSAILKNETCREHIRALHELGVRIVLDHFGTGYSSLLDLADLPVWRIKLDREFVEAVNIAEGNRSMGRAIIAMAHSMGVEITVFGVDTEAQAQWLKELGCDAMQGAWIGPARDTPDAGPGLVHTLKTEPRSAAGAPT